MILVLGRFVTYSVLRILLDWQWWVLSVSEVETEGGLVLGRVHSSLLVLCLDRGVILVLLELRVLARALRTGAVKKCGNR